jgi:hypothetical protein
MSLWDNIRKRRAAGKRKLRPGDKNYPKTLDLNDTTTASIPNPADTAMGPRVKSVNMFDKRRRKDKHPVLLRRFRKYLEDNGVV